MQKLDSLLLSCFQKLSDKIQFSVGLTNFHLAKVFLTLTVMAWTQSRIEVIMWSGWDLWNIFSLIIGPIFYFYITYRVNIGEQNCHQNSIFKSNLLIEFSYFRFFSIFYLVFSIFITIKIVTIVREIPLNIHEKMLNVYLSITSLFEFMTFYFASCTPKPPKPSKLKQFLESKKVQVRPATV